MKVLDLFCGGGGASMGIHQSGVTEIVGVDIKKQKDYPFTIINQDVLSLDVGFLKEFDFIWASPPCQRFSSSTPVENKKNHPDLIQDVRDLLTLSGKPFVIENVMPSPINENLILCGEMFSLKVIRHRKFEIKGFFAKQPKHKKHKGLSCMEAFRRKKDYYYESVHGNGSGKNILARWKVAMGIDWMTSKKTLAESIPPAYSKYIFDEFKQNRPTQQLFW